MEREPDIHGIRSEQEGRSITTVPRVTLEQWRMFQAVVDHGGFAQAAEKLHKSQSAISYSVQKLQDLLGVEVLEVRGRKAHLTEVGSILLRRSRHLTEEAVALERVAESLGRGLEAVVYLAVEAIFPNQILMPVLGQFSQQCRATRIEVIESVLSGTLEQLQEGRADLAITGKVPPGFIGDALMTLTFVPVTHPDHPLQQLDRKVTLQDLKQHRQVVVRDSGIKERWDAGWLEAEHRLTVSNMSTSIQALVSGLGFAWVPELKIVEELQRGDLKPLSMAEGQKRHVELYLVFRDRDHAGPALMALAELLREACQAG